jgi:hypothetical protein
MKQNVSRPLIIIGCVILVLISLKFGIIGGFLGAALAGAILKKYNIVSPESAWVKETKGVKIAKYIVLGLVLFVILGLIAYFYYGGY